MKEKNYTQREIEIADYLFSHPEKNRNDVIAKYCKEFQRTERTIDSLIKKAKEYNQTRIEKQEKAKDEVLCQKSQEFIKRAIIDREEAKEILSRIAKGTAKKIGESELIIPTASEQVRAIQQLSKMEGWDAPTEINTHTNLTYLEDII